MLYGDTHISTNVVRMLLLSVGGLGHIDTGLPSGNNRDELFVAGPSSTFREVQRTTALGTAPGKRRPLHTALKHALDDRYMPIVKGDNPYHNPQRSTQLDNVRGKNSTHTQTRWLLLVVVGCCCGTGR